MLEDSEERPTAQYVYDAEVLVTAEGRGSEGWLARSKQGVSSAGPTPGQASGDKVRHRSLLKEEQKAMVRSQSK